MPADTHCELPKQAPAGALDGVRVLDLSRVLAGPWATQILGDLGADVIKIERPGAGDDTRAWGPPFLEPGGDAAYFTCANRNKRSVTVDFTRPEGADLIRKLAADSRILVENFKVGGLKKYGLDYESIKEINPSIVYCSITGFGQNGPLAGKPGYDYLVQAAGGLMSVTGHSDGQPGAGPLKVGVAVADLATGLYATIAILAALRHAEATGEGQHLDLALLDCQVAMLANQAANHLVSGRPPGRLGNAHPNIAPYQVFATADGHMVLAVGNDGQFAQFCAVAGLEGLAADPAYARNRDRVARREALAAVLAPVLAGRPTAEWIAVLDAAGVPCGPIQTIDQVFEDPQVRARGLAQRAARADGAEVPMVANPIRMDRTPPVTRRAPPALGADTRETLGALLGLTAPELDSLVRAGIV